MVNYLGRGQSDSGQGKWQWHENSVTLRPNFVKFRYGADADHRWRHLDSAADPGGHRRGPQPQRQTQAQPVRRRRPGRSVTANAVPLVRLEGGVTLSVLTVRTAHL